MKFHDPRPPGHVVVLDRRGDTRGGIVGDVVVGEGGSIDDLHPPGKAALADYAGWRKERGG